MALCNEYETLRILQPAFARSTQYAILDPLGFVAVSNHGVMVTRWFQGAELDHHARVMGVADVHETFRSAGVWLRKLYEAGDDTELELGLEVGGRIDYLRTTYASAINTDRRANAAFELLGHVGRDIDTVSTRGVRLHGDFKPGNMLCNGSRYVGLDIQWKTTGAAVYDLAPFVNHLWLGSLGGIGTRALHRHETAEAGFLAGFGDVGDVRVLRWTQLYFALCYWGRYRQGGAVAAAMARWKLLPLIEKVGAQLRGLA